MVYTSIYRHLRLCNALGRASSWASAGGFHRNRRRGSLPPRHVLLALFEDVRRDPLGVARVDPGEEGSHFVARQRRARGLGAHVAHFEIDADLAAPDAEGGVL